MQRVLDQVAGVNRPARPRRQAAPRPAPQPRPIPSEQRVHGRAAAPSRPRQQTPLGAGTTGTAVGSGWLRGHGDTDSSSANTDLCRPPPRSVLDIVEHQPLAAHNIGSASSRSHSRAGDICRHAPTLSCSTGRTRIASNGGHHGLARTIEVPRPDAAAEPPSGAPRLRLCRRGPSNGRRRATGATSPSETTEPPQSGHLDGHGSRTSTTKRVRQPEHRPGRVSRRAGCVVGR